MAILKTTPADPENLYLWEGVVLADTLDAVHIKGGDYSVHANGNFSGAATVEFLYSSDKVNYDSIDATNLLFSANGLYNFKLGDGYIKPVLSAGDGSTDINLRLKPIPRG